MSDDTPLPFPPFPNSQNIAFSFLTLVVISTYTATLTQFVQTGNKLLIPDPGHLMGRKVAAYGLYVDVSHRS